MLQEYIDILNQPYRTISMRMSLLNYNFRKVDEITSEIISGDINIDTTSDLRNTISADLLIKNSSFTIGKDKKIWIDKFVRIEIGEYHIRSNSIIWINCGIFMINQPSISIGITEKTLHFDGVGLMAKLTGARNGYLQSKVILNADTPITAAVKTTVSTLGGFTNVVIEETNRTLPYTITKEAGSSIYELLKEIRDLYMDYEMFFDVDGTFYYQRVKNKESDPVIIDFNQLRTGVITNYGVENDFENVKNKIIVNGRTLDDGTFITYTLQNTNPNSPFNVNNPGIGVIPFVYADDKIWTTEQAQTRAEYELWKRSNFNEKISLNCVPTYFLFGNEKVRYGNSDLGINGDWIITNINMPLDVKSTMSLSGYKLYPTS